MTTPSAESAASPASEQQFLIVGAGLAGASAAKALRDLGHRGPVVLIGDEPEQPYERPPLSKGYLMGGTSRDEVYANPTSWYAENDVALRTGTRVIRIDRESHRVTLDDGESLGYAKLLLTTGSEPRRIPIPGADLDGVVTLRRLSDSDHLRRAIADGGAFAIIGGGWIGLEVAAAARAADVPVTVLEAAELPLLQVLGPEMAGVFADLHRSHGVRLFTGVGVAEIVGHDGVATGVRLSDGTEIPARTVLMAVGARPVVELAEAAGLAVENGVLVDEHLRTSDPDVFAAGDIANAYHPGLARRLRVEHWANALHQPPVAAAGMLGRDAVYDNVPYFYTDQYDLSMEYRGHAAVGGYDQVVVRGDVAARVFTAFWLEGGRVVAAMNVNSWDETELLEEIVRRRSAVDPGRLADPSHALADVAGLSSAAEKA
jgi:3-phenylpropionate/trans-cinnamate dioxygenase ferredoxin reductase subunit